MANHNSANKDVTKFKHYDMRDLFIYILNVPLTIITLYKKSRMTLKPVSYFYALYKKGVKLGIV